MIKLRFENAIYRTYCDGKITTCSYKCTLYDTDNKFVIEKFTSSGKSRCADYDVLDPQIGRALAEARAKRNAYKRAKKTMTSFHTLKDLRAQLRHITDRWMSLQTFIFCYEDECDHIKRLMKHESHI